MPVVNIFLGGTDFSELKLRLPRITPVYEDILDEAGNVIGRSEVYNYLSYGNFLSAVINFFILAMIVFFIVKGLNKLSELGKKKEEEVVEEVAPPEPSAEEVLLTEIRDLLKDK